jgi:hypothetical protein
VTAEELIGAVESAARVLTLEGDGIALNCRSRLLMNWSRNCTRQGKRVKRIVLERKWNRAPARRKEFTWWHGIPKRRHRQHQVDGRDQRSTIHFDHICAIEACAGGA